MNRHTLSPEEIKLLCQFVETQYNLEITAYNAASVCRRFHKILHRFNLNSGWQLMRFLHAKPHGKQLFLDSFLVHVTSLFREPIANSQLIKGVFHRWKKKRNIHIWMPGCSTGEEVLSLAILLHEHNLLYKTRILATDLNENVLHKARYGCLPLSSVEDAQLRYQASGGYLSLDHYYHRIENDCFFLEKLLKNVQFEQGDVSRDLPAESFDMVWCKNLLIYFRPDVQTSILNRLFGTLHKDGILHLGEKESITFYESKLKLHQAPGDAKFFSFAPWPNLKTPA